MLDKIPIFDFEIPFGIDDHEVNRRLMKLLRTIRTDLKNLVLCGYDGDRKPRINNFTFGIVASEIRGVDTFSVEHPLMYASDCDHERPSVAVYDRNNMDQSNIPESMQCIQSKWIYRIDSPEALLAIIRIIEH